MDNQPQKPERSEPTNEVEKLPVWRSEQLFDGNREVLIQHLGETYRLRQTRNGRLILQK